MYEHCGTRQERSTLQLNGPGLRWLFARVIAPAPQPEPSNYLKSAMRDTSFLRSFSRCRRYV